MFKYAKKHLWVMLLGLLTACAGNTDLGGGGPRLLQDVALEPTTPGPTRELSPTFTSELPTLNPAITSERQSPLQVVTIQADFVIVTPTLPPSKTPTQTPTITVTPSVTLTPTLTVTSSLTAPVFPTSIIIPVTAPVNVPIVEVCDSTWLYMQPPPAGCPLTPPTASQGVYQTFEYGQMIWVGFMDEIFVMYSDSATMLPRWARFRDTFDEGEPEEDPAYSNPPSSVLWQPRRGFGKLWRDDLFKFQVRDRVGWATMQLEQPYSLQYQQGRDGAIFISRPDGGVFGLHPTGIWTLHAGYPFGTP